ncbi:hypothetical protein E4T52_16029 [Aureobasidium sp. EXF-3400]|nr:hypothetical protein E4T51_15147 [Aureobasidium sp. EXF-12344]KAI4768907.1 hypothetical protein E4T52_16029 [Aureobasidium sp. EXF-3400]
MAPKRSADETNEAAQMQLVSPRSNSSVHGDDTILKVDSPSEKQIAELVASESALMDSADDLDMDDDEAAEDEDLGRPYKRICRGRESALSLAMSDQIKKSTFSKPILVRVGTLTNSQDFHIHAARLAASSPYFTELLDKQPEEDTPLELPEDDPIVFQLYAHYIYDKKSITSLDLATSNAALDSRSAAYDTYIDLLQAYIFGEKVQNSDFQNEVMNRILQCIGDMHNGKSPKTSALTTDKDDLPSASSSENIVRPLIELLYPSLPPDSIGRGLVVETFIVLWSHSDVLQNFVPDVSRELLTEIAEMLLSGDKDHIRDAWAQAIDGDYSYYHSARSDEH